ncbi:chorion class high-cysteine HCB protein 12-like [Leguminivora glycinivorella]|uniref:chorion class high-cysteine HCB protein 12-like n=1 Tax=Leguminivora glycinivorella TaxID=1035111 RepID=UPI00201028CA|nr:chorion class high-cysteine HCB protein 12-like [Leguminivora glycinivorella]
MAFKVAVICAFALLVQGIAGQYCGCSCQSISIPSSGGDLLITALGPVTPSGIAVATDLSLSGDLDLSGALPYLSAVAFEGQFPTSGSAPVCYGCGDNVAITQQIGGSSGCGCGCGRR